MAESKGKMTASEAKRKLDALLERFGTQAALAQKLKVDPATVNRWLAGNITAEPYIKLGNLAEPKDRLWFWAQAGLDIDELLAAAAEAAKLPLHEQVSLRLRELPPNTEVFHVDEKMGGAFPPGDDFLLGRTTEETDPKTLINSVPLFYFDKTGLNPGSWLYNRWPEGLYVGRLKLKRDPSGFEPRGEYILTAGPLTDAKETFSYNDESFPVGPHAQEADKVGLYSGARILGIVIAWFPARKGKE